MQIHCYGYAQDQDDDNKRQHPHQHACNVPVDQRIIQADVNRPECPPLDRRRNIIDPLLICSKNGCLALIPRCFKRLIDQLPGDR